MKEGKRGKKSVESSFSLLSRFVMTAHYSLMKDIVFRARGVHPSILLLFLFCFICLVACLWHARLCFIVLWPWMAILNDVFKHFIARWELAQYWHFLWVQASYGKNRVADMSVSNDNGVARLANRQSELDCSVLVQKQHLLKHLI